MASHGLTTEQRGAGFAVVCGQPLRSAFVLGRAFALDEVLLDAKIDVDFLIALQ